MKILIERQEDNVVVSKDYSDIEDRGEISHVIVELELIKLELLGLWNDWEELNSDNQNEDDVAEETPETED